MYDGAPRWTMVLIALGSVLAVFGVVIYAMNRAYAEERALETTASWWLMIGGTVAFIIGAVFFARGDSSPEG
jgi:predicted membrane channel-forming protein YqfA (hemolysin III family)